MAWVVLAATPAWAQADDEAAREAEMFGSDDAPNPEAEREAEMFGTEAEPEGAAAARDATVEGSAEDAPLGERLRDRLEGQDDPTTVGGFLYLRLDGFASEDDSPRTTPLRSPSLFDIYLDARPNERVRAYVRGRLRHDFTVREGDVDAIGQPMERNDVLLDQLWLRFDAARFVYFTVGKQPIRWGSGRFWNPTDFLNPQIFDPLALFDERNGVALVKAHVPIASLNWNLYAVANVEGARRAEQVDGALRAEMLLGPAEIALSVGDGAKSPTQLGFDVSAGIWDLDLHLELAARHGVEAPFYKGPLNIEMLQVPTERTRKDDWIVQGVAGAEIGIKYSDEDSVILAAEYLYNDAGYRNASLYPWLLLQGAYVPLYVGRHYLAATVVLVAPGSFNDTTIFVTGLGNLSDESTMARFDYRVRVVTYVDVNVYAQYHFGERGGELRFALDVPPLPFEGLEEGFSVAAPVLDVGIGLRVYL